MFSALLMTWPDPVSRAFASPRSAGTIRGQRGNRPCRAHSANAGRRPDEPWTRDEWSTSTNGYRRVCRRQPVPQRPSLSRLAQRGAPNTRPQLVEYCHRTALLLGEGIILPEQVLDVDRTARPQDARQFPIQCRAVRRVAASPSDEDRIERWSESEADEVGEPRTRSARYALQQLLETMYLDRDRHASTRRRRMTLAISSRLCTGHAASVGLARRIDLVGLTRCVDMLGSTSGVAGRGLASASKDSYDAAGHFASGHVRAPTAEPVDLIASASSPERG